MTNESKIQEILENKLILREFNPVRFDDLVKELVQLLTPKTDSREEVFTRAEKTTLLQMVEERQEEGSYFGNKEQYYKRLENIKKKLKETL